MPCSYTDEQCKRTPDYTSFLDNDVGDKPSYAKHSQSLGGAPGELETAIDGAVYFSADTLDTYDFSRAFILDWLTCYD